MRITRLGFRHYLAFLALVLSSQIANAATADGRVFYVSGGAYIIRGTEHIPAARDVAVESGDVIVTEDDGRVQWRMADDSYFALRPNSRFKIEEYEAPAGSSQGGKAFYELLAGGFRTISGLIGKSDPSSYKVRTGVATMGIRGTDHTHVLCQGDCNWAAKAGSGTPANGLYSKVDLGGVTLNNSGGKLDVNAGQFAFTGSESSAPSGVTIPAVFITWRVDFEFHFPGLEDKINRLRIEPCEVIFDPSPSTPPHGPNGEPCGL